MTRLAVFGGAALLVLVLATTTRADPATTATQPPDPVAGEQVYARCLACHSLAANRTGPRHCGLLGRQAGTQPDYEYSKAMRRSGITWDAASLDRFLAAPMQVVPGTKMTYIGVPDAVERSNLVAYLAVASVSDSQCAAPQEP